MTSVQMFTMVFDDGKHAWGTKTSVDVRSMNSQRQLKYLRGEGESPNHGKLQWIVDIYGNNNVGGGNIFTLLLWRIKNVNVWLFLFAQNPMILFPKKDLIALNEEVIDTNQGQSHPTLIPWKLT